MALEDYLDSEVAIAVTATAIAMSPRGRRLLRRGAVYGVAGALKAGDLAAATARGVARGVASQGTPGGDAGDGRVEGGVTPTPGTA